jgi:hypothetical protein
VEGKTRTRKRLIAAATMLATAVAVAACANGDADDPPAAASSPSGTHAGHGKFKPPPAAPLRAGERFVNVTMPERYTPSAPNGGTDEYRCFLVDPKLTSQAFLTGSQFLPENIDIVHHAIFFRIAPTDAAKAKAADDAEPGAGWRCFSGSGVTDDDSWVASWAPGANEVLLKEGLGYSMPPGSLMVMQVHYNLLAINEQTGKTDQSAIRLRLTSGDKAMAPLETLQLPAPVELPCTAQEKGPLCDRDAAVADVTHRFGQEVGSSAAGLSQLCRGGKVVAGKTQYCDHRVPTAATIYATAGHMHLLGRSITIDLNPGTAKARRLLNIPAYNFDDQAVRPLAQPVTVKPGDVLRVTCTHDAGLRQQLPQLKPLPPRYVVWGDGTSDEMCLGLAVATVA